MTDRKEIIITQPTETNLWRMHYFPLDFSVLKGEYEIDRERLSTKAGESTRRGDECTIERPFLQN